MNDKCWIQTYSGRRFYPLLPDPDEIEIEDIAHALAMKCRYGGHTREFYSVAQHSVIASTLFRDPELCFQALLHDAAEAYMADVPSPVKARPEFAFYREAEDRLQAVIFKRFGLPPRAHPLVHDADRWMIHCEAATSLIITPRGGWEMPALTNEFKYVPIRPWNWPTAKERFLDRFDTLSGEYENTLQGRADKKAAA